MTVGDIDALGKADDLRPAGTPRGHEFAAEEARLLDELLASADLGSPDAPEVRPVHQLTDGEALDQWQATLPSSPEQSLAEATTVPPVPYGAPNPDPELAETAMGAANVEGDHLEGPQQNEIGRVSEHPPEFDYEMVAVDAPELAVEQAIRPDVPSIPVDLDWLDRLEGRSNPQRPGAIAPIDLEQTTPEADPEPHSVDALQRPQDGIAELSPHFYSEMAETASDLEFTDMTDWDDYVEAGDFDAPAEEGIAGPVDLAAEEAVEPVDLAAEEAAEPVDLAAEEAAEPVAAGLAAEEAVEPVAAGLAELAAGGAAELVDFAAEEAEEPVAAGLAAEEAVEPVAAGLAAEEAVEPVAAGLAAEEAAEPVAAGLAELAAEEAAEPVAAGLAELAVEEAVEPVELAPEGPAESVGEVAKPAATKTAEPVEEVAEPAATETAELPTRETSMEATEPVEEPTSMHPVLPATEAPTAKLAARLGSAETLRDVKQATVAAAPEQSAGPLLTAAASRQAALASDPAFRNTPSYAETGKLRRRPRVSRAFLAAAAAVFFIATLGAGFVAMKQTQSTNQWRHRDQQELALSLSLSTHGGVLSKNLVAAQGAIASLDSRTSRLNQQVRSLQSQLAAAKQAKAKPLSGSLVGQLTKEAGSLSNGMAMCVNDMNSLRNEINHDVANSRYLDPHLQPNTQNTDGWCATARQESQLLQSTLSKAR